MRRTFAITALAFEHHAASMPGDAARDVNETPA